MMTDMVDEEEVDTSTVVPESYCLDVCGRMRVKLFKGHSFDLVCNERRLALQYCIHYICLKNKDFPTPIG